MTFKTKIDWETEVHKAVELGKQGRSLVDIGNYYGVSRQRIKQVFQQYGIDPASVGIKVRTRRSREERAAAHFKKWGTKEDTDLYHNQRQKFRTKKANAKTIGWEWTVEFGDLTWPTHCPILGIELDYFAEACQENSPSFDQRVAGLGYVKGNVDIMSWRANRIKNNGTAAEHRLIADYLDKL